MRTPRLAAMLTAIAAALVLSYLIDFAQVTRVEVGRSDFTSTYVGATLVRDGHGHDLYSEDLQAALHASLIAPDTEGNLPFVNPPTAALLALPLTSLSLAGAYGLMALVQLALLAAAIVVAVRAAPWPHRTAPAVRVAVGAVALAGTGTLNLLLLGQWDGVGALGLALAYAAWRSGRGGLAGFALALAAGVAKPHLMIGLAALVVARRDRRLLIGAVSGAAGLMALDLLVAGPGGVLAFLGSALDSTHRWQLSSMLGLTGLTGSWLGDTGVAHVLAAAGSLGAVAACGLLGVAWRRDEALLEPAWGGATALSLVAAPHLLGHDLALLAPMSVVAVAWASGRDGASAWPGHAAQRALLLWLLVVAAARLDLGNAAMAPPGRLVPWTLLVAGGAAVAVCRGRSRSRRPTPTPPRRTRAEAPAT